MSWFGNAVARLGWRLSLPRREPDPGVPFSFAEVERLAFGSRDDWPGELPRERWEAYGGAVVGRWRARVADEHAERLRGLAIIGRLRTDRPLPWPVDLYGLPR